MSEFFGKPRLGYKEDSVQQPGLLGDEFDVVVSDYIPDLDMYSNENAGRIRVKWLKNTSESALKPGSIVKSDAANDMAHDVTQAGADQPARAVVDPFLSEDVAAGEKFLGVIYGEIDVLSSAAITKGASISSAANGKAVTNDLSTVAKLAGACGVMIEAATAADQLRRAFVDFRVLK